MRQSHPNATRRSPRTRLLRNYNGIQDNQPMQQYYNNIDYALEALDNTHALAYLKIYQQMSRAHHCLRANLAHQLADHQHCLSFVRQCLKLSLLCQKCIQIFLEHHTEHELEDHKLRRQIIKSIQQQKIPELNRFLQGLAFIAPSYKIYKRLADEIQAIGGQIQKILIMETSQSNRKIIAKRTIHLNEQILFIPKKMLITLQLTKTLPLVQNLLTKKISFKSPKHNQLTIFILHQYELGQKSPFYNYLSLLPTNFQSFPIYYSQELLGQLKGSSFLDQISQKKQDLKKDYEVMINFDPTFQRFSYQSFVKTRLLISSRVFGIVINKTKTDAMVPYADMLNHHLPKQTSWFYCNESEGFVIQSLKQIPIGNQIFDSYGQKCNSRFLLNYGFTLEQNLFNEVTIEIQLSNHLTRQRGPTLIKLRISRLLQSKSFEQMISTFRVVAQQKQKYQSLISNYNNNHNNTHPNNNHNNHNHNNHNHNNHNNNNNPELDDDEQEIDLNIEVIKQTQYKNIQNQLQAWTILNAFMANRLKQYKNTLQEDNKLLQENITMLDINFKNIVILRKGEKEILIFYQRMARKMIKYLNGQKIKDVEQYQQYISGLKLEQSFGRCK